jgi:hypothetical protein
MDLPHQDGVRVVLDSLPGDNKLGGQCSFRILCRFLGEFSYLAVAVP